MADIGRIRAIYERQADRAYRIALVIMKDSHCAEDVVQGVFVTLIEKDIFFENDRHETAWIIRVVKNRCMDMLKSKWRSNVCLMDSSGNLTDVSDACADEMGSEAEDQIEVDNLKRMLMKLPAVQREVLLLKYYEGFTVSEVAEIMGIKESSVRSAIASAKRNLTRGE